MVIAPLPDDPEMLAYVKQVAREMRVDENTAWAMIQGGEGGASTPPPTTGQPAPTYQPQQPMQPLSPQPPGRRDRAAEVAQSMTALRQPSQDSGLLAMFKKGQEPKTQALSSVLLRKMGMGDPNSTEETTLAGLALEGLGFGKSAKEKLADKSVEKINPFSPTSDAEQQAQNVLRKRKTLGASLAGMFMGRPVG